MQHPRHILIAGTMPAAAAAVREEHHGAGLSRKDQLPVKLLLADRNGHIADLHFRFHNEPSLQFLPSSHINASDNSGKRTSSNWGSSLSLSLCFSAICS